MDIYCLNEILGRTVKLVEATEIQSRPRSVIEKGKVTRIYYKQQKLEKQILQVEEGIILAEELGKKGEIVEEKKKSAN